MNIRTFNLLLAGLCLISAGCQREAAVSSDSFHLSVQPIISDADVVVSLLKIRVSHEASISVDCGGMHSMVVLPNPSPDETRDGQVALVASRIARQGDSFAYIQTLIRPKSPNHGFAGGPAVYTVPVATTLGSFFSISATDGDYKLDAPLEIARLEGKPVTLVIGKPTK